MGTLSVILKAAGAYIGTGLDDLFVLVLLFAAARDARARFRVAAGQTLGVCVLTGLSVLGARAAGLLPGRFLFLLGLIPLGMGLAGLWRLLRLRNSSSVPDDGDGDGDDDDDDEEEKARRLIASPGGPSLTAVLFLALSDGGDNVGVWVSVFAGLGLPGVLTVCAVFLVLTVLLCAAAAAAARLPVLGDFLRRLSPVLVPVVFLLLGIAVLLGPLF